MSTHDVRDYNGNPLSEGDHVTAWLDGQRYTATVKEIKAHHPGDGNFRRVILVRDDHHTEVESFSDAVVVIKQATPYGTLPHRCAGCGTVRDILPGSITACGCGMEHVDLTREEGRMFMQALALDAFIAEHSGG